MSLRFSSFFSRGIMNCMRKCLFSFLDSRCCNNWKEKSNLFLYIYSALKAIKLHHQSTTFIRMSTVNNILCKCLSACASMRFFIVFIFSVRIIIVVAQFRHVTFFISMEIFIHSQRTSRCFYVHLVILTKRFYLYCWCFSSFHLRVRKALKNGISVAPFFHYFTAFFCFNSRSLR